MLQIAEHKEHFTLTDSKTHHSQYINKDTFWSIAGHLGLINPNPNTEKMQRGNTDVETLALNSWTVGDILEGDEGHGPDRILITSIGEERFLCRLDYKCKGVYADESGSTTLTCREWKKVRESEKGKGLEC